MSIYLLCATLLGVFTKAVSFKPHGSSGNRGNNEELGTQKDRVGWLASGLGEATLGSWRGCLEGTRIRASTFCCLRFCLRLQEGKVSLLGMVSLGPSMAQDDPKARWLHWPAPRHTRYPPSFVRPLVPKPKRPCSTLCDPLAEVG